MPASRHFPFVLLAALAIAVLLLFAVPSLSQQKEDSSQAAAPEAAAKATVAANYGRIPLSFEANRGQTDRSVQFLSRGQGYTLFLRPGEAVLALRSGMRTTAKTASPAPPPLPGAHSRFAPNTGQIETSLVRMKLAGANAHAAAREEDEQITRTNYFIGNDPAKWRTDIPNYGRVRFAGIYPGIDLVYYGNQNRLEHDFVVAPGADPTRIRLALDGAEQMRIDPAGDLILDTGNGELRLVKPVSYQESNGGRTPVVSAYKLLAKNQVGFQVASYDHAQPLVIDPVLVYSTYLGGNSGDFNGRGEQANGIAVDSAGSAYVVGVAVSVNFPVTAGAFQTQNKANRGEGGPTAFVSKFDSTGKALVYSTYLGGSGNDFGFGIALDSANQAYVTGTTSSTDFPVICGAFQLSNEAAPHGGYTGFVTKLNVDGSALAYSTYLGGSQELGSPFSYFTFPGDVPQAIALSATGNAYVTGYTDSTDFPVTDGAFQTVYGGDLENVFITELNAAGTGLVYSTYLGGNYNGNDIGPSGDFGNAIVIDARGDAFVTGATTSANFPVTDGAFQSTAGGLLATAFVAELNPAGTDLIYSTLLGGSNGDSAQGIAVDAEGFAYVAGSTDSSDFPLTAHVLEGPGSGLSGYLGPGPATQGGYGYGPSGFLTKLNRDGSALEYSTYIEGLDTKVMGLAIDNQGSAYLTGNAAVQGGGGGFGGFKATPDALPTPTSTGNSAFVVKLNPNATVLNYATLLGGSGNDSGQALAVDPSGNVYVTGSAGSSNFPVTPGAFQPVYKGEGNAFVSKFALAPEKNRTAYPALPSIPIPTKMADDTNLQVWTGDCSTYAVQGGLGATLTTGNDGPTPTGDMDVEPGLCETTTFSIGTTTCVNFAIVAVNSWPYVLNVTGTYTGNGVYAPSSFSDTVTVGEECASGSSSHRGTPGGNEPVSRLHLTIGAAPGNDQAKPAPALNRTIRNTLGPKFVPPAPIHRSAGDTSPDDYVANAKTPACITYLPVLTVTIGPAEALRLYGAANPTFTYTLTGLHSGDKVTVDIQLPATAKSPVGEYAVTATVGGADANKYYVAVVPAMLTITPAPVTVTMVPATASRLYGASALPFTVTKIAGLLFGDKVTAVPSGAAKASPVGRYQIWAALAGPAGGNYRVPKPSAILTVTPAPLKVTANNLTMKEGGKVPRLTYTITRFVNHDTASVVTGSPVLSTTATSKSKPGTYPITVELGTLKAENYSFTPVGGVLTVEP
jgi:hypothetical protein